MKRSIHRRWTTGGFALLAGGALLAVPAPAANDGFDILVTGASLADDTVPGVGGDGRMVLFTTRYSNTGSEEVPSGEDLEERPYLRPNLDLFRWRPQLDVVDQFTATSSVEDADGTGYLVETYNDQPAVVSRTVLAHEDLIETPFEHTVWAAAYRSNADQNQSGPAVSVDDLDPRLAGGGTGHIFVKDSDFETPMNVFENFAFAGEVSLDSPSLALKTKTEFGRPRGFNDEVITGQVIEDVFVAFSGTVDFENDNADGNEEIYLWRRSLARRVVDGTGGGGVSNGGVVQITHTLEGRSWAPSVNDRGEILFLSTADLTGDNPEGHTQLFLWTARRGFRQMTRLDGEDLGAPRWSSEARCAVFAATADPVRRNPDENGEIFVLKGRRIRQITRSTTGSSSSPSLDPTGRVIAFLTDANLPGMVYPSGVAEIAAVRTNGQGLRQITLTGDAGVNEGPVATKANRTISVTWVSSSNYTGQNSNGNRRIYTAPVPR